jgi:hypothetical protein
MPFMICDPFDSAQDKFTICYLRLVGQAATLQIRVHQRSSAVIFLTGLQDNQPLRFTNYDLRFAIYNFIRVYLRSSFGSAQDGVCGKND